MGVHVCVQSLTYSQEMRRRVQLKRHAALERARREERLIRMKEDRKIRQEIVLAIGEATGLVVPGEGGGKAKGKKVAKGR